MRECVFFGFFFFFCGLHINVSVAWRLSLNNLIISVWMKKQWCRSSKFLHTDGILACIQCNDNHWTYFYVSFDAEIPIPELFCLSCSQYPWVSCQNPSELPQRYQCPIAIISPMKTSQSDLSVTDIMFNASGLQHSLLTLTDNISEGPGTTYYHCFCPKPKNLKYRG